MTKAANCSTHTSAQFDTRADTPFNIGSVNYPALKGSL